MVDIQNGTFFDFSIYTYMYALHSEQCIKSFRRTKYVDWSILYSRKQFLTSLPQLFKKWVGYLHTHILVECLRTSHVIAKTITKLIDFYSQGFFTFLFATVFNWNDLLAKLILSMGRFYVISLLFWLKNILVSIQRA